MIIIVSSSVAEWIFPKMATPINIPTQGSFSKVILTGLQRQVGRWGGLCSLPLNLAEFLLALIKQVL